MSHTAVGLKVGGYSSLDGEVADTAADAIEETIKGFNAILDGEVDDLPEQAFLNVGTIEDAKEKAKQLLAAAQG